MAQRISRRGFYFAVCIGLLMTPVLILLSANGEPELVYPVMAAAAAIAIAVRGRWDLRDHWWFWITLAAIICVHVALILYVPWKAGWIPAPLIAVASIADFALLLGVFSVVESLMTGRRDAT